MTPLRVIETAYHNQTEDASENAANNPDSYWNTSSPNVRNAARTTALKSGTGSVASFSDFFYDNFETTANVIETRAWDSHKGGTYQAFTDPLTASNSVSTTVQYDPFGNPVLTTDANGNQTQMIYGPVAGFSGLYPTEVKSAYGTPVQQTVQTEYDPSTGLATRVTALGNTPAENVVGETEYDPVGRPVREKSAVGTSAESWESTEYDDIELRIISRSDVSSAGDGLDISISHFDQLGRIRLQRTIENPATENPVDETHGIKVQTRYRTVQGGAYTPSSNPFRAATAAAVNEPTMGWEVEFENADGDLSTTENSLEPDCLGRSAAIRLRRESQRSKRRRTTQPKPTSAVPKPGKFRALLGNSLEWMSPIRVVILVPSAIHRDLRAISTIRPEI
ncbi:MAG: hypothetical protein IPJ30_02480 [Acidobacteria bacterium]|nr:hypothetical protein [Acidobacteriota bacterium]